MKLLTVNNLQKSFEGKKVVDNLSFYVKKGEVLGFLGPNGAGKSTSINIVSTVIDKDNGEILFENDNIFNNIKKFKRNLGVVPQDLAFFNDMSAYNNVKFFGSLYGLRGIRLSEATDDALNSVGLWEKRAAKAKTFSGGMKRRLNIACSIVTKPQILIMDEPTVGIDPQSRNQIMNTIQDLNNNGTTIIYVSHYMEEVEQICSRILIIDNGKIIEEGSSMSLKQKYNCDTLEDVFLNLTGTELRDS